MSTGRTKDDIVSRLTAEELMRVRNDESFWRELQLPSIHDTPIEDDPRLEAYGMLLVWPYCCCGYCHAAGED